MITIIIPCFNEEAVLPLFFREIEQVKQTIQGESFEYIFIDDGSTDNTLTFLRNKAISNKSISYISFSRNFGKEAAIYAGLKYSNGDYIVIMDADLQDPPSLLPEMYRLITKEGYDSVATRRITRKGEPPIRSFFARRFYHLMKRISEIDLVDGARDFRMMNRKFVNALLQLDEYNRFSKGLFGWVGFKTKWIEYENVNRAAGETKWSFFKLLFYAIDGIVAFSSLPLSISAMTGIIFSVFSFLAMTIIIVRKLLFGDPVDGWASLVTIIFFTSGIQMMFIGILGKYLSKTYLEVKNRPIFIIQETYHIEEEKK